MTSRTVRLRAAAGGVLLVAVSLTGRPAAQTGGATLTLPFTHLRGSDAAASGLRLDGLFVETTAGRLMLPASLVDSSAAAARLGWTRRALLSDGRTVTLAVTRQRDQARLSLTALPATGV